MEKSRNIVTLRVTRWNLLVSLLLIAVCAFQPNATPVNEWSLTMWFWLTLPVLYAAYVFVAVFILKLVGIAFQRR